MDVSDIFYLLLLGEGEGESEARGAGFIENRRRGGGVSRTGGAEGAGRVAGANWGILGVGV